MRQGNPKVSRGSLARVLGADHRATMALAKAAITMAKADLWRARLVVKTLRRDQRAARGWRRTRLADITHPMAQRRPPVCASRGARLG